MRSFVLSKVTDVRDVAHVHVWSITSGKPAATMEISLREGCDAETVTERVKAVLAKRYDIRHATIEINWSEHAPDCSLGALA